jgi:hypothetical protein
MRKLISFFILSSFVIFGSSAFAQKIDIDSRLQSKFSKKELKSMDQDKLAYWTFFLDNSYQIVDIPKEKPDAVAAVVTLKSIEKIDINVFELGFAPHAYARDYARIEGTDKMFVILPQNEIDELYKVYKK